MSSSSVLRDWTAVNAAEESVAFDAMRCCAPRQPQNRCPIDEFYHYQESVLLLGNESALSDNHVLGRIVLLALVSGVESYFRNLLAGVINSCPIAREVAAKQSITLGAIDYYTPEDIGLGVFENTSFATEGEIRRMTKNVINIDLKGSGSLAAAIDAFDKVAHLRHAAVHSSGHLNSKNFTALRLKRGHPGRMLTLELREIHEIALTCRAVVRAYNRYIFSSILKRWVEEGLVSGEWQLDRQLFIPIFKHFRSRSDGTGAVQPHVAYRNFRDSIVSPRAVRDDRR